MIRILKFEDLTDYPELRSSMFKTRAHQFSTRLQWPVTINSFGEEQDQYDSAGAIYVIYENSDGTHGGSMRFRPSGEKTMLSEYFSHLVDSSITQTPNTWEATRFCISKESDQKTANRVLLGAMNLGLSMGLNGLFGVFENRMLKVYHRLGWAPKVVGGDGNSSREGISVGLWTFDSDSKEEIESRIR